MNGKMKGILDNMGEILKRAGADENFIDRVKGAFKSLDGGQKLRKRMSRRINQLITTFESSIMTDVKNQDDMSLLIGGEMEDILDGMAEMSNMNQLGQGSYIFYQQAWNTLKTNFKKMGDFSEFKRQFKIMLHGIKRLILNEDSL